MAGDLHRGTKFGGLDEQMSTLILQKVTYLGKTGRGQDHSRDLLFTFWDPSVTFEGVKPVPKITQNSYCTLFMASAWSASL